ncbi:MAG: hypothetical protein EXQ97_06780 [Alphaproteobacteria bacterium]|nr:hypothetical protein [Alphaproteobacteria bacterium]
MSAESVGSILAGLAARLTPSAPRPAGTGAPLAPAPAPAPYSGLGIEGWPMRRGARLVLRV